VEALKALRALKIALNVVVVVVLYPLSLAQTSAFFRDDCTLLSGILLEQIIIKGLLNSSQKLYRDVRFGGLMRASAEMFTASVYRLLQ
jgi:hypothetical protein